jgi:DNA end-binding protein Ku
MKAIWRGAISFGLVNIPVGLFPTDKNKELKFHLIDARDEHRIKYQRTNEITGEEVPWEKITKAFAFDDGSYVVMTDDDFEKADPSAIKTLDIETFIKQEELSLIYLEKPYYIVPDKGGEKPYVLLREAMKKSGKIAVARIVMKTKGYLAAVYPLGDALVLNMIRFHDELYASEDLDLPHEAKISDREMGLAESLIDGMTTAWQPESFKDEYRDAVMRRIESKAKKSILAEPEEPLEAAAVTSGKIVDITDLLKRSIEVKEAIKTDKSKKAR